jgi:hypothetical protein
MMGERKSFAAAQGTFVRVSRSEAAKKGHPTKYYFVGTPQRFRGRFAGHLSNCAGERRAVSSRPRSSRTGAKYTEAEPRDFAPRSGA